MFDFKSKMKKFMKDEYPLVGSTNIYPCPLKRFNLDPFYTPQKYTLQVFLNGLLQIERRCFNVERTYNSYKDDFYEISFYKEFDKTDTVVINYLPKF